MYCFIDSLIHELYIVHSDILLTAAVPENRKRGYIAKPPTLKG